VPTGSHAFGQPASPDALLDLEVVLAADQLAERQDQLAVLAGRLSYRAIWLATVAGTADPRRIVALRALSGDAVVGISFSSLPAAAFVGALPVGVLLEIPAPGTARDSLVEAVGGVNAWSERVRVRGRVDDQAAGVVIAASDRAGLLATIAAAALASGPRGRSVVAAVTVSIGRTASEAAARASRDPHLAGDFHPRHAGVFGTLDDAQEQVLALARAGADTLLATLPDDVDVADLLAQLRSAVAGPTPLLHRRQT
jgi:hypothetical protein